MKAGGITGLKPRGARSDSRADGRECMRTGLVEVVRIERFTADVEEDELLHLGASLERRSSHPLAKAIIDQRSAGFDRQTGGL